jgi:hypothetical protein
MRSIIAIVAGSLFIVFAMLILQLAYIFIAVAYNALAKDYLFLSDISGYFRYIIGIPVFIATMFAGGYIVASVANMESKMKVLLHCIAAGLFTVGGMMYSAMENADITVTGISVTLLALTAATAGGLYWLRGKTINAR